MMSLCIYWIPPIECAIENRNIALNRFTWCYTYVPLIYKYMFWCALFVCDSEWIVCWLQPASVVTCNEIRFYVVIQFIFSLMDLNKWTFHSLLWQILMTTRSLFNCFNQFQQIKIFEWNYIFNSCCHFIVFSTLSINWKQYNYEHCLWLQQGFLF